MMLQLHGNVINVLLMLGNPVNGPPSVHCPAKKADVEIWTSDRQRRYLQYLQL